MGFLSGVLGAVKNENEVITYDKYISEGNKRLKSVLDTLNKKIGTGREGLAESVGAVKGWLEGYDAILTEKTKNVTKHLETLSRNIETNINDVNSFISYNVFQQHDACRLMATKMTANVNESKEALKQLDKNAQNILTPAINSIHQAVDAFTKSAENNDVQKLSTTAREELNKLEKEVNDFVNFRVTKMGNDIEEQFNKQIEKPIIAVDTLLKEAKNDLGTWIEKAAEIVQQVKEKTQDIHRRLVAQTKEMSKYAKHVQANAEKKIADVFTTTRSLLKTLTEKSVHLDAACRKAEWQLQALKGSGETCLNAAEANANNVDNIDVLIQNELTTKIKQIKHALKQLDVIGLRERIQGLFYNLSGLIEKLSDTILGKRQRVNGFITQLKAELVENINSALRSLNGPQSPISVKQRQTIGDIDFQEVFKKSFELVNKFEKAIQPPKPAKSAPAPKSEIKERSLAESIDEAMQELETKVNSLESDFNNDVKTPLDLAVYAMDGPFAGVQRISEVIANQSTGMKANVVALKRELKNLQAQFQNLISAVETANLTEYVKEVANSLGNAKPFIVKYIEGIAHDLNALTGEFTALQSELQGNPGQKTDVINRLEDLLTNGIRSSGEWPDNKGVKGLTEIQKRIANNILGEDSTPKENTLAKIVKDAKAFYITVLQVKAREAIGEITKHVEKEFSLTTDNIRKEAQRIYANRKKKELEELKDIVAEQKSEIQNIIERDRSSGVRGLLSRIDGNHEMVFQIPCQNDFSAACNYSQWYLDPLLDFIKEQVKTPVKPSVAPNENENSTKVHDLRQSIDTLLTQLRDSNHFDRTFTDNLAALKQLLTNFPPSSFSGIFNGALLDGLRAGLDGLCAQLCYAYVNTYDGRTVRELIKNVKPAAGSGKVDAIYDLTDDGRKAAKVCLTALKTVCHDLIKVRDDFMSRALHKYKLNKSTELGKFITDCGFVISDQHQQNGELRNSDDMKGTQIIELLKTGGKLFYKVSSHIFAGRVIEVNDYLCDYYAVCNLTNSSSRQPCNVYEMLCWLTSLQYNAVYTDMLRDGIGNLLETPEKALGGDDEGLVSFDMKATYLNAYPKRVTYGNYEAILEHICAQSYILLTKIRGTGDAATYYAVDCFTNALKLKYPATGEECLDMLLDILRRLFPPLKYLLTQCSIDASNFGWRDCPYGKDVPTVKWPCNEHSKEKPKDQPNCQPSCQAKCQAKCQVNCQSNSPLMSYLYDCLPGHLPHQLSSIGCKYTCSTCATGKTGMPCLTPLGFRGFSGDPKTGKDLCDVLTKFFEHEYLSSLFSLAPKAPSTLPEHLSFTLSLVKHWNHGGRHLIQDAFTKAIIDQSIGLYEQPNTLTSALCNVYGNIKGEHRNIDADGKEASLPFTSLTASCTTQDHCAPYLRSLCDDTYAYLVSKQAGTYLSWAIYSPWTLWNYVQCLLKDFQNISCKDWGCRGCARGDQCKRGQHGLSDDKNRKAHCQCRSIVGCRGTSPTFYRYGFTYASSEKLIINGTTCSSFVDHLSRVLQSQYMKDLLTECDNFLWIIRQPFIWLNVALWVFSLLYLIHIMVIRLDLLHIKSHLHSPSSHRIAAQSLLAAGRVNKLGRVFYLQP
ncbi:hypothetical protein, conserved [Babesia bigemina]|uniref:C3H1-type domain-containing protein n=1 Tax=Babesia bigemina TaxID=5866 RepID=A0A061BK84_BABBI|nr:hypothetical protein, conserved [Babesia bigemina]CDR71890.1 hypothetical protein, conserved [Babesia bigemina]|eukprot:XP_012770832.1 hypothetical protein, conserved [Babesia bigemina]